MAIIYTYPIKTTPSDNDLILISDSEDSNKTKQVKISTLPGGSGSGVSSVTAVLPLASTGGGTPAISLTGLTGFGTTGQVIKVNSSEDGLEWGTAGGSAPQGNDNNVQLKSGTGFAGSDDLDFDSNVLSVKHTLDIKGQGNLLPAGRLKLYCENSSHGVTLEGPAHTGGGNSYILKFPSAVPNDNEILEFTNAGGLGWIPTPSGGPGAGTQYAIPFWSTTSALSDSILSQDALASKVVLAASKKLEIPNDGTTSATAINFGTADTGINGYGTTGIGLVSGGQSRIEVTTGFGTGQDITLTGVTQSDGGLRFGSNGETLNSYEEGSWTPTSANANTISNATGDYTRIGDMVFAQFSFTMTGSTSIAIASLPFQGSYTSALKGAAIISKNTCLSVQGQIVGGQFTGASTFTFNAYFGGGSYNPSNPSVAALPLSLYTTTSSLYQTSGGTYAGTIIYETTE